MPANEKTPREEYIWKKAMYLVSRPDFKNNIRNIRKKFDIPMAGFRNDTSFNQWANHSGYYGTDGTDIEELIDKDIIKLLAKPENELTAGWRHAIKRYLFFNNVDDMQLPIRLDTQIINDATTQRPTIHVVINDETSKEDYVENWTNIQYLKNFYGIKKPGRRRKVDDYLIRRKKFAYEPQTQLATLCEIELVVRL